MKILIASLLLSSTLSPALPEESVEKSRPLANPHIPYVEVNKYCYTHEITFQWLKHKFEIPGVTLTQEVYPINFWALFSTKEPLPRSVTFSIVSSSAHPGRPFASFFDNEGCLIDGFEI